MTPDPCKCAKCRERTVSPLVENYCVALDHDGRAYEVTVPSLSVLVCAKCGNRLLDREANRRVSDALREAAGLLTPTEIRHNRAELGLTQKELAERLKIAEATLSRWETGAQIQQRGFDLLLRLYFEVDAVRVHLAPKTPALQAGGPPRPVAASTVTA